ncbi:MAG: hypothetical protein JHC93_00290 [Parachlamydiales bacterium]|nr:hypothetical protein [Parachlamydiales bacterium]
MAATISTSTEVQGAAYTPAAPILPKRKAFLPRVEDVTHSASDVAKFLRAGKKASAAYCKAAEYRPALQKYVPAAGRFGKEVGGAAEWIDLVGIPGQLNSLSLSSVRENRAKGGKLYAANSVVENSAGFANSMLSAVDVGARIAGKNLGRFNPISSLTQDALGGVEDSCKLARLSADMHRTRKSEKLCVNKDGSTLKVAEQKMVDNKKKSLGLDITKTISGIALCILGFVVLGLGLTTPAIPIIVIIGGLITASLGIAKTCVDHKYEKNQTNFDSLPLRA